VSERGKHKPEHRSAARLKLSAAEEKAALARFDANLYPPNRSEDTPYPGQVIDRLNKAGLPVRLAKSFLWAYAIGADKPRREWRERKRIALELLRSKAEDAPLKERLALPYLQRLGPNFDVLLAVAPGVTVRAFGYSAPGQEAEAAERRIEWIQKSRVYALRRFGTSPLEYLIELQEYATHVGNHIKEGEMAKLVDAAVTAVHPGMKETDPQRCEDKTAALARSLNRFRKQNQDFIEGARPLIAGRVLFCEWQTPLRPHKPPTP
jgi:hypothetical protein